MDWPLIHLTISHFPVILAVTGAVAMLVALVRSRRAIWLYATVSLTLAAATVVAAYFTGQPAARTLIDPTAGGGDLVGAHEGVAKIAALLVVIAGLAAGVAWRRLVRYPRELRMPRSLRAALVVTSLAAAMAIGYASWLGNRIVHDPAAAQGRDVRPRS